MWKSIFNTITLDILLFCVTYPEMYSYICLHTQSSYFWVWRCRSIKEKVLCFLWLHKIKKMITVILNQDREFCTHKCKQRKVNRYSWGRGPWNSSGWDDSGISCHSYSLDPHSSMFYTSENKVMNTFRNTTGMKEGCMCEG